MSSEIRPSFTKGCTVRMLLELGSRYSWVTVWKRNVYFIVERKQHSTVVAAHHDGSRDREKIRMVTVPQKSFLIPDNNSKPYFLTCMILLYRYISTEIIPFQLTEMSQGKPICRFVCLFQSHHLVITRSLSLMLHCKPVILSVITSLAVNPYPF